MTKVITDEHGDLVLRSDWHEEDFLGMDDSLTKGQIRRAMELIARTHDANIGINWDVLGTAIEIVKEETMEELK